MTFRKLAMIAGAAFVLAAGTATAQQPNSQARIAEILASPDRSAADRTNDQRRKPADILAFIAIVPGITALDLSAGGGYTTELLARSIGPDGAVYGQSRPRDPNQPPPRPAAPEATPIRPPQRPRPRRPRPRPRRRVPRPSLWPTVARR